MSTCHSFAHLWHVAQDLLQACLVEPQNVEYRKALADVNERIKIRNQVCEGEPARPLLSFHITTRIRIVTYAAHRRDLLAANIGTCQYWHLCSLCAERRVQQRRGVGRSRQH